MNKDLSIIGVYPENYQFESDYLPLIAFKTEQQKLSAEKYILNKVDIFFKEIVHIRVDDVAKSQISYPKIITQKDFQAKQIKYFYKNIFYDLGQRNSKGELNFSPKWGITFDEKCAPISVSWLSPRYRVNDRNSSLPKFKPFNYSYHSTYQFNYKYGIIDINKKPFFYYIYFTLQELLDAIK